VESAEEAVRSATVVLQYYRENADYKERLYDFVPRVGLEEIRRVVADPDLAAELLERFRIAKAAVTDPWLERDTPYHPHQFSDLDPPAAGDLVEALVGPPVGETR
jgi:nitrite reductase (NADH) large subunit